jgi:hypothetical protein
MKSPVAKGTSPKKAIFAFNFDIEQAKAASVESDQIAQDDSGDAEKVELVFDKDDIVLSSIWGNGAIDGGAAAKLQTVFEQLLGGAKLRPSQSFRTLCENSCTELESVLCSLYQLFNSLPVPRPARIVELVLQAKVFEEEIVNTESQLREPMFLTRITHILYFFVDLATVLASRGNIGRKVLSASDLESCITALLSLDRLKREIRSAPPRSARQQFVPDPSWGEVRTVLRERIKTLESELAADAGFYQVNTNILICTVNVRCCFCL